MRPDGRRFMKFLATKEETVFLETLRKQFTNDAELLRSALYTLADEQGLAIPEGVFDSRKRGNPDMLAARTKFLQLMRDPEYRQAYCDKMSEAHLKGRTPVRPRKPHQSRMLRMYANLSVEP